MANVLRVSRTKLDREFAANPKYKKYEAQLQSIDKNGDGEIDVGELCEKIDEMATIEKQHRLLKWTSIITGVFALLTIAATVGLVYAVVSLTKDSNVSSTGILVTKDSAATPIATGQAINLDSINNLYTKSLDDLAKLSFIIIPSANGGRVVHVAEVELVANTSAKVTTDAGTVYVIDASGIHEEVANKTTGTTSMRKLLALDPSTGEPGALSGFQTGGTVPIIPAITTPNPESQAQTINPLGAVRGALNVLDVSPSSQTRIKMKNMLISIGSVNGKSVGYDEAGDGTSALQKLRQSPFNLAIVDNNMEPMTGVQFIKEVRSDPKLANTPILLLTTGNPAPGLVNDITQYITDTTSQPNIQKVINMLSR